jgi:hypothetical protein
MDVRTQSFLLALRAGLGAAHINGIVKHNRSADGILVGMPLSGKAKQAFRRPRKEQMLRSDKSWTLLIASTILPRLNDETERKDCTHHTCRGPFEELARSQGAR